MKATVKALLQAIPQPLTSAKLPFVVKTGVTVEDFEVAAQDEIGPKIWWEFDNGTVTIYEYSSQVHALGALAVYGSLVEQLPEIYAGVCGYERIIRSGGSTSICIADAGFVAKRQRTRVIGSSPFGPNGRDGTMNWDAVKVEFALEESEEHADTKAEEIWLSHGTTVQAVICVKACKRSRTLSVKLFVRTTVAAIILFNVPLAQVFGTRSFIARSIPKTDIATITAGSHVLKIPSALFYLNALPPLVPVPAVVNLDLFEDHSRRNFLGEFVCSGFIPRQTYTKFSVQMTNHQHSQRTVSAENLQR
eukprot:TRINITY_DN5441_c1_g2_i2.p1 TRINITY_DN5441_c1_g2~~TRINITY_DN5441_c1_g2_i2.p1  ORF type:complete len:305 (+),score=65.40 TRINITY_DN5441_c1_g2_i2:390-1304(+)